MINRLFNDWNLFFVLANGPIWLCIHCTELCGRVLRGFGYPQVTRIIWMKRVKNNVMWSTRVRIGLDAWRARVRFCDCHFQGITCKKKPKQNSISDTSTKICLHFKMISIYISYELIHACLRPPRTPIPYAGLLSFLKLASVQFSFGCGSVSIYSISARCWM